MKKLKSTTLCVCGCCKRLSGKYLYINKKTGLPGNYCKECRKTVSRNHRKNEKRPGMRQGKQLSGNYLYGRSHVAAGTYSACPETVAASIERKRRKVRESEFEYECGSESQSGSVFELNWN